MTGSPFSSSRGSPLSSRSEISKSFQGGSVGLSESGLSDSPSLRRRTKEGKSSDGDGEREGGAGEGERAGVWEVGSELGFKVGTELVSELGRLLGDGLGDGLGVSLGTELGSKLPSMPGEVRSGCESVR